MKLRNFCHFAAICAVGVGTASGGTINWGDAVGGPDRTSSGLSLNNTFSYQLGTFGNAFTPNISNVSGWSANWKMLDSASYNNFLQWFSSSLVLSNNDNGTPGDLSDDYLTSSDGGATRFYEGEQVYIWIYNSLDPVPGSEWALVTRTNPANAWKIPASAGSQQDPPISMYTTAVDTNVFGGTNGNRGPGEYTFTGAMSVQTATFAPIPEPSSLVLVGGIFTLLLRRRR